MRVTFVTSNSHKYREIEEILRPFGIQTHWLRRELPEPQADDLRAVVQAKLAAAPIRRSPIFVEDSGLFLTGLRGFPGVYSRYVYDTVGLDGIMKLVRGKDRRAVFRTVAGVREGRKTWFVEGRVLGTIARKPRGSRGFGYDPLFIPSGSDRTYAEMTPAEKGRTSHRARAVRAVARGLRSHASS